MAGRPWIKLYQRWLTCPRHSDLDGDTLGTGALLLLVAEGLGVDGEDGERWLLCPDGAPVTLASCHRRVRVRSASCRSRVEKLLRVGTMVQRSDGCLGFAKYRQWQENPSAPRVRKHRSKRDQGVTSNVTGNREAEDRRQKQRTEAEKNVAPQKATTKRPPSDGALQVAQHLYDAIRAHTPTFLDNAAPSAIARKLTGWARDIDVGMRNDGMTVDGCIQAIDAAHQSDDTFWHSNILSGKKLRKHYERLRIRQQDNGRQQSLPDYNIDYHAFAERMNACGTKK